MKKMELETSKRKGMKNKNIKMCSININGLNNKLDVIQNLIEDNQIDIMCIQEIHLLDENKLENWSKIFNYKVLINQIYELPKMKFSKEGTIIILNQNIINNYKIKEELIYKNRIQYVNIENENENFSIFNCYFSNKTNERMNQMKMLNEKTKMIKNNIIILGDFNFIEDKLDTKNEHLFKISKDKIEFQKLKEENDLIDIYRKCNKNKKIYTYQNRKGATRIDRIYISSSFKPLVENIKYTPTIKTDHILMPVLQIKTTPKTRWGPGKYKLNNSILKLNFVKDEVQYIWKIHQQSKIFFPDLNEWWEKGKQLLTNVFKNLSMEVNQSHYQKTKAIKNKLLELLNDNPNSNTAAIASLKEKLTKLYERKYEGFRIRAKMQKIENEIPDKTFYQKEKEQGKKNALIELKNQENKIINKPKEILEEVKEYYYKLWGNTEKEEEDEILEYLDEIDKQNFEENEIREIDKFIEEKEIEIALNLLNNESSPGSDGLTAEFYKTFQKLIISDLKEVFNNALLKGILPKSMREAIVKLLHKKRDFKDLKNWRPISLLNTDYKILSKIMVNRLTPLFQKHILPQQNAGLPRRRIENVHYNIQALLELANQRKEEMIIMTIDFEKAFDKVSHHFIFKIMEKLKIGNKNLGFIKLFYKKIFSKIEINGDYTSEIKIKRGIRQGCPLSMLLFITCTDLFTRKIQKNKQIKGVNFQKFNFKITQYADDTTFAFQNYKEIKDILEELKKFEKVSGLKINPEKTQIIATNTFIKTKIQTNYPLFKFNDYLKILGVKFYLNPNCNNKNWYQILPIIKSILHKHENRKLTIYGKNQIIKTLIIPLFIHIARIYKPSEKIEKDLNQILYKFLWSNDPIEQLSRKKLISEYKEGGIKMTDITSKLETCYVEKIKYLYNIDKVTELWQQWSLYNLFYKIKHINSKLYNGATAHAFYGNKT